MTTFTLSRLLLVAIAIIGIALAAPVVSAHGNATSAADVPPYDGSADEWTAWMDGQMTDHMGPGAVEWMESHMGVTLDEMAQDMVRGDYAGEMYGQDHC